MGKIRGPGKRLFPGREGLFPFFFAGTLDNLPIASLYYSLSRPNRDTLNEPKILEAVNPFPGICI